MSTFSLRAATSADVPAMLALYAHYVLHSTATFETEVPSEELFALRLRSLQGQFPWLVCQQASPGGKRVIGYAYLSRLAERRGYDWVAATSIYIADGCRHSGAGRMLYTALEEIARLQGYRTLYGALAWPNPASAAFHQRMGFVRQGLLEHAGYKFGQNVGVAYYAKDLLPVVQNPPLPVPYSSLDERQIAQLLEDAARPSAPANQ